MQIEIEIENSNQSNNIRVYPIGKEVGQNYLLTAFRGARSLQSSTPVEVCVAHGVIWICLALPEGVYCSIVLVITSISTNYGLWAHLNYIK